MTGVGTRWLARDDADDMALIGTGTQAITQVAAVHAVRPLRRVRVWSPTAEKRRAFASRAPPAVRVRRDDAPTLEAATEAASIVTLVTRAKEPFLHARMLAPGTHLNAVGAILPANAEFHQDVFERVGAIAVDDLPNLQKASREFIDRFGAKGDWSAVQPLGALIAAEPPAIARLRCVIVQGDGHGAVRPLGRGAGAGARSRARRRTKPCPPGARHAALQHRGREGRAGGNP